MKIKGLFAVVIVILAVLAAICIALINRPKKTNVLLISIDTLRPDCLGCYGCDRIRTPNIDALANDGILFSDAITNVPLTLPSHATILTGLCPLTHRVRDNGTFVLDDQFTTLAEIFKQNGYSTAAFIGAFVLDGRYGLNQGFDHYDDTLRVEEDLWVFDYPQRQGHCVTDAALRWFDSARQPFFAFVHYYDPHTPYQPPPPFDSIYAGRPYDGEVAYSDYELGRLLEGLSRRQLRANTLVVIVSDHGEGLGEHGERVHGILIYESTMKVVFVINLPDKHPLKEMLRGARIDETVGLMDVAPTIIDLVGIDYEGDFDGSSLVPLLKGKGIGPRFFYLETMYPFFAYRWSPLRGIRFNKWKLIYAPKPELYDLTNDPHESKNLVDSNSKVATDLRKSLELMVVERESKTQTSKQITPEEERKLSALGYVSRSQVQVPADIEPKGPNPMEMVVYFETYLAHGMEAFTHGLLDIALKDFAEMVKVDPTNIEARMLLGRTLLELGRTEEAKQQFLEATRIDPTFADGFFRMGIMSRQEGNLDKALVFFATAAKLQPQFPGAIANVGAVLLEKGMIDSARIVLGSALAIDPKDQAALMNMALSYVKENNLDSALVWFHRVITINPTKVKALVNIADVYARQSKPDSTIAYLEKARAIEPSNLTILRNLGNMYRLVGQTKQAEKTFKEAIEIDPNDYMALFGLAGTKAEQGEIDESLEILKKVLKLKPDFEPARTALNGLMEMKR